MLPNCATRHKYRNSTEQSKYIWQLKDLNKTPKISWEIAAVIRCAARIDCCKSCLTEKLSLCEKCPYSELFWSAFSRIWTEYGEILRISPYSVRMLKNVDQNNYEYGHFLHSVFIIKSFENKQLLNKKSELVNTCRYKNKLLLKSLKRNHS